MKIYRFKNIVYDKPYAPYFDEYKGFCFFIESYNEEDETHSHVYLKCTDENGPSVKGCVETYLLEHV